MEAQPCRTDGSISPRLFMAQVGPNGEIIMDYSIYDAKEAGFNKVVFII